VHRFFKTPDVQEAPREIAETDYRPACPLEEVLAIDELRRRPRRRPNVMGENEAVALLSAAISERRDAVFPELVNQAMLLCHADSAGLSVEDTENGQLVFRWIAVAGHMEGMAGRTMPRDFSPCGETVARNTPVLMQQPVRHYPYIRSIGIPLEETLLVPFSAGHRPIGTMWAVAHAGDRAFDAEDARVLALLANFAAVAYSNSVSRE
jgi:GAF domain-containing protein